MADQIGILPEGLQAVVTRAQTTEMSLQAASLHVKELRDSVPSIIERLENSDYGSAISQLRGDVAQAQAVLEQMRKLASEVRAEANSVTAAADSAARGVEERVQRIITAQERTTADLANLRSQVDAGLQSLGDVIQTLVVKCDSGAATTAKAYSQVTNTLKGNSEKLVDVLRQVLAAMEGLRDTDIAALLTQAANMQATLDSHSKILAAISSKKGIYFR